MADTVPARGLHWKPRERAEHLARRLEANRSRAIKAEVELVEAIGLLETLKLQTAI